MVDFLRHRNGRTITRNGAKVLGNENVQMVVRIQSKDGLSGGLRVGGVDVRVRQDVAIRRKSM